MRSDRSIAGAIYGVVMATSERHRQVDIDAVAAAARMVRAYADGFEVIATPS